MNERDLYLMYLGGKITLKDFRSRLLGLVESKMPAAVTKGQSQDQLDALALPSAQALEQQQQATPVTSTEDTIVKNYRQQVLADQQSSYANAQTNAGNGAVANPQMPSAP